MGFLENIDSYTITFVAGVLMLCGSFATINSNSASKFDHDLALILLIAGILCVGAGLQLIDLSQLKDMVTSK